jgi:hypothetical protein
MKETAVTLNDLEATVARLETVVKYLDCRESVFGEIKNRLDSVKVTPSTETAKQKKLTPETVLF